MTDYDHPWKEALDVMFESFVAFCVPDLYSRVDWTTPPKMLDKELQQIAPESEIGVRSVDKLVEVRLVSGEYEWLLIHVEVQSQPVADFAQRMFAYFYRIVDKYIDSAALRLRLGCGSYSRGVSVDRLDDGFASRY